MERIAILCFFLSIFSSAIAQNEKEKKGHHAFSQNHFTINLQNGLTRGKAEQHAGPLRPDPRTGHVFHANLNYTANFSETFGASIGSGLGAFPTNFEFYQLDLGRNQYFDDVEYIPFVSFRGELNYRHRISNKYILNGFGGLSALNTYDGIYERSYLAFNQPDYIYNMRFEYKQGWKPFVHLGAGISKTLSNRDMLTFRLDYNHSLGTMYTGTYSAMPGTPDASTGLFNNRGHHLNLGLAYTFTRGEKEEKISNYIKEGSERDAGKNYKKEKRVLNPGSTLLGISGGITRPITKAQDPNGVFLSAASINLMPYVYFEQNLEKNYYAEGGFGVQEYFYARKTIDNPFWSGGNAFIAYQFSLGGGKRIIGKNNHYNYLNLSAGAVLNVTDMGVGLNGGSSGGAINEAGDTLYHYDFSHHYVNKINPLLYLGASKDFRISGGFYFTMLYRYHQGFMNLLEQRGTYTSTGTEGPQNATLSINGSFHTFQLGLKFNVGNFKEKQKAQTKASFSKGTLLISAMPGINLYQNKVSSRSTFFQGGYAYNMPSLVPAIGAEYYLNDKNFLESRVNFHQLHHWNMSIRMINLSMGAGRRIELEDGFNLFNLSTGFSLSKITGAMGKVESSMYHNYMSETNDYYLALYDERTMSGSVSLISKQENDTISVNNRNYSIGNTIFPTIYLGISKDFRINDKTSIGIAWFKGFGFIDFYKEVETTKSLDYNFNQNTTMNGTSSQVVMSLKYRLK